MPQTLQTFHAGFSGPKPTSGRLQTATRSSTTPRVSASHGVPSITSRDRIIPYVHQSVPADMAPAGSAGIPSVFRLIWDVH